MIEAKTTSPFSLNPVHGTSFTAKISQMTQGIVEQCLGVPELNRLYGDILQNSGGENFCEKALQTMNVRVAVDAGDLARIPRKGPAVIVSNHPFGAIEGVALARTFLKIRPDVRFMANYLLGRIPEIREIGIFVDPFGGPEAARSNFKAIKESIEWVKQGGLLAVFPSGEVSHFNFKTGGISDPEWNKTIAGIIRKAGAPALPAYVHGRNSLVFQLSGFAHPRLRTALLGRELLSHRNKEIRFTIGNPISSEKLRAFSSDSEMIAYLRLRTYFLQNRTHKPARNVSIGNSSERIVLSKPGALLAEEVGSLPGDCLLLESGDYAVFCAKAHQIPHTLHEIGRLREMSFREVGEGTGLAIDLDDFDEYYKHVFIWHRLERKVVGSYRIMPVREALKARGIKGLYTNTLFRFKPALVRHFADAVEVGRSFVAPDYQKSYVPLMLLWQGVSRYIVRNPHHTKLFGPVSISNCYNAASRQLIAAFLKKHSYRSDLSRMVVPRDRFEVRPVGGGRNLPASIEDISEMIADIETEQKGVPVLLRQYLKLGGKFLGFNLDRKFSDVLDGLVLVDLLQTDPRVLKRYMGGDGLNDFLQAHPRKSGLFSVQTAELGRF